MYIPRPERKGKPQAKINALTFAKLMAALLEGDYTLRELAEETGLHYVSVLRYCRALRRENVVHVAGWRPDARGNMTMVVYRVGNRADVPKPIKQKKDIARDYRARKAMKEMIKLTTGGAHAARSSGL